MNKMSEILKIDMNTKTYKVNEIFYSLQGEGARAGTPNTFVRFSDCNLTCTFCDTEFLSGVEMTAHQIGLEVIKSGCGDVIFTGGEPLMQLDMSLINTIKSMIHNNNMTPHFSLETNGSIFLDDAIGLAMDWLVCSPKVAEHVVKKNLRSFVSEFRYVRKVGQGIPQPLSEASFYCISPEAQGDVINKDNLDYCIQLVKDNPKWALSTQQHKIWGVR